MTGALLSLSLSLMVVTCRSPTESVMLSGPKATVWPGRVARRAGIGFGRQSWSAATHRGVSLQLLR